jgi:hypothetical protein
MVSFSNQRLRIMGWIKKQELTICDLQEMHLTDKNKHWHRVKWWTTIFQPNRYPKHAGIAILISDKVDFKPKSVRRNKKGHFVSIKGTINQEEIIIVNIYVPNVGIFNFIKQTVLNLTAQTSPNTIINFSSTLSSIDLSSGLKNNKETSNK